MIASDPYGYAGLLAGMMVAVFAMRAGGYWLLGRIYVGARLYRMLDALPGIVIAAIVAPILVRDGLGAVCAVLAATLTMKFVRNDFAAVIAGIAVAALARAAGL